MQPFSKYIFTNSNCIQKPQFILSVILLWDKCPRDRGQLYIDRVCSFVIHYSILISTKIGSKCYRSLKFRIFDLVAIFANCNFVLDSIYIRIVCVTPGEMWVACMAGRGMGLPLLLFLLRECTNARAGCSFHFIIISFFLSTFLFKKYHIF